MNKPLHVALVTGGCSGIGHSIAQSLLQSGATVYVGSRSVADQRVADDVSNSFDGLVRVVPLDVCSSNSVDKVVAQISAETRGIDILVNCAGVSVHQTTSGHTDQDWHHVLDTNLSGSFRTIRSCLPAMKEAGWGRIVNIASTAAHSAVATHAAYCASKAGLLGLTRAVALEGAPFGVNCVSVSPTWVETPMLQQSVATMAQDSGSSESEIWQDIADANPQRRLVQCDEIASVVAFLCGDVCTGLTMEDIQVNAGAHW